MNRYINFNRVKAVVVRNLFEWRRNLDRVIDSVWWASVDIIFWGLTSTYLKKTSPEIPDVVSFFLGGIILWVFVQNSQRDINMPLLSDAWNRNLVNLFTTPIKLSEFILGTIILGLIKLFLTISTLFIISFFLYQYNFFNLGKYLVFAIVNLILVGWWVGFFIDGLILRFGYRVEAFAWALIFVIYPFSAIFYPVSILPVWAQLIARILPTSYLFESMREVLFTGTFSFGNILIASFLNIFYIVLAVIFLKLMFKEALKNAKLVKLN